MAVDNVVEESSSGEVSPPVNLSVTPLAIYFVRSCPECSGAENPETANKAARVPPGADLLSCSARYLNAALRHWRSEVASLGFLKGDSKSEREQFIIWRAVIHSECLCCRCAVINNLPLCRLGVHRSHCLASGDWISKNWHLILSCLKKP